MKVTILEGKKIPEQVLKLLDVKKLLKDKVIKEEKSDTVPAETTGDSEE